MKAIDTNIILRYLIADDPIQTDKARAVLRAGAFVSSTVLLETGWVLGSRYRLDRNSIADLIESILDLPSVHVPDPATIRTAIELYRSGADFADAVHLATARGAEAFVTFDRDLARLTGTPLPVELA